MASEAFTISVEIDTKGAVGGLKDVQKELEKTSNSAKGLNTGFASGMAGVQSGLDNLTAGFGRLTSGGLNGATDAMTDMVGTIGAVGGAFGTLVSGIGLATIALIANSAAMAAAADDAAEAADKLGLTTTELAALTLAAKENGTSVSSLVGTYDRLINSLDEVENGNLKTINAFRALGIAQSDLAGKSEKEIAGMVIKNYDALGRTIQATAAAQDILGKSFRDQIPAIRAVANEYKDYEDRIAGTVASKALEEAGARQEKAFSDLGLEITRLKMAMSGMFTETATEAATWSASIVKEANKVVTVLSQPNVSWGEAFIIEMQARMDVGLLNTKKGTDLSTERTVALNKERQAQKDLNAERERTVNQSNAETARLLRGPSQTGGVTPRAPIVKPEKLEQAKLTEEQKAVIALTKQMDTAFNDLNRTIALNSIGTDAVSKSMADLAYKLYDTGRGTITLGDAFKLVAEKHKLFEEALSTSNSRQFNEQIKSMNADFSVQLQLLTATTEQEREQIRLRAQLTKMFENQRGGATPEQMRELDSALKSANEQYKILQGKKIDNSVNNAMKDLTDQTEELNFEIENFWSTNKNGIISTNSALKQLERQIDPEGRGKNISDAQREQIRTQLELIEAKKAELEVSRQIEDSYKTLGDAATQWALGTEGGIKRVRLALLQLLVLQSFKAFAGGVPTGPAGSFLSGVLGGLAGARAEGGPVDAGKAYLVGEKGPEIVKFNQSGYVIPNNQITSSSSRTSIVMSPNLIIQGSVTGQTELENMFDQFAVAMAAETQNFVISQRGQNGILAR